MVGERGRRDRPHEGLDLCLFRDHFGRIRHFNEKTRIPAMYDGKVVNVLDDFLGRTVIMAHSFTDKGGSRFCTMYGHTALSCDLHVGKIINQGEIIATVAEFAPTVTDILPHLHISMGGVNASLPIHSLDWNIIGARDAVTLIDPLCAIDRHCRLEESILDRHKLK